jgi:hypothetical protein
MMATDVPRALCFVLMPFGAKRDANGELIDFDEVYRQIIRPAIEDSGLEAIRADEEHVGGIIHKAMFERLLICEYAVGDLTAANPNVYYELGIRHAVRPWSTALVFADGFRLPFDVESLRCVPYHLDDGVPSQPDEDRATLAAWLHAAQEASETRVADSPVFALLDWYPSPDLARLRTDTFRDEVEYSTRRRDQLRRARQVGVEAIREVLDDLGPLSKVEVGVVVDVMLSFRSVGAEDAMIDLFERRMGPAVKRMTIVREQYAFALNRVGRHTDAEHVLLTLIDERGPSSETYGLLGRVYKDQWEEALREGRLAAARGLLDKAIATYLKGFETDWRDAYPGINVVELMELRDPPDPRRGDLLPVVEYSVRRRLGGTPDYWDHATLLELAVLRDDAVGAAVALERALAEEPEPWQARTTLQSMQRILTARAARSDAQIWLVAIVDELTAAAG